MMLRPLAALALSTGLAGLAHAAEPLNKYNLCSLTRQTRLVPVDPALWAAAKDGDTAKVAAALAAGADPNGTDADGFSLLDLAITEHQDAVLAQLLKAGADVNQPFLGTSPLRLMHVSTSGAPSAADEARRAMLEKAGASLSDADVAFQEVVHWGTGSLPNAFAASLGDADNTRLSTFVRSTYDINQPLVEGLDLLHIAVKQGRVEAVSYLIGCGANVNARTSRGAPVMWFAKDRPEVVKLLQAAGATSTGFTQADIRKFYDDHPALFADRKVYALRVVKLQGAAARRAEVAERTRAARSADEMTAWLASQGIQFTDESTTLGAEGVPLPIVDRLATLAPGQSAMDTENDAVYIVVSAQPAPKAYDATVRAAIEHFLVVDATRHVAKYVRPA